MITAAAVRALAEGRLRTLRRICTVRPPEVYEMELPMSLSAESPAMLRPGCESGLGEAPQGHTSQSQFSHRKNGESAAASGAKRQPED